MQVARCTKIINADSDDPKYVINVKQFAKFVVNLHKNLAPTDVEEGMRVGSVCVCVCMRACVWCVCACTCAHVCMCGEGMCIACMCTYLCLCACLCVGVCLSVCAYLHPALYILDVLMSFEHKNKKNVIMDSMDSDLVSFPQIPATSHQMTFVVQFLMPEQAHGR